MDFKKYNEIIIEFNKLNLAIEKTSSATYTRLFDYEILKIANTEEDGIIKFENKEEFIDILRKLTSNNVSNISIIKINDSCQKLGIKESDQLYVRFYAI